MDKRDIVKLRKNYTYLVTNLDVENVLDYLHQENVLSLDDLERIRAEVTSQDKARKLLSMLPKRSTDAYAQLIQAFHTAEVDFITKKLEGTEISGEELENSPDTLDLGPLDVIPSDEVLLALQSELKQRYIEQFLRVDPLPWSGEMVISLPEVYTELDLREKDTYNRAVSNESIPLTDIFKTPSAPCKTQPPKRIYIQAIAGMGKTILCNKIAYDWATGMQDCSVKKFTAVFFLEMKEGIVESNLAQSILDQLLPNDFKYSKETMLNCIKEHQSDMLLIVDGYDELSPSDKKSVEEFLQGKYMHQINCVLTSRPTHIAAKYFDLRLKCYGFTPEKAREFVGKYFCCKPPEYYEKLIEQVENSCYLKQLAENPLDCLLLCIQWEDNQGNLPRSLSQLFTDIVNIIVLRYFEKHHNGFESPEEESQECQDILSGMKEIALQSLLEGKREFSMKEIQAVPQFEEILKLGVFYRNRPRSRLSGEATYSFNQRNIQEILAAMHVPSLDLETCKKVFSQFLSQRNTAILVIFIMGVFKTDDVMLKELFKILAENNRENYEKIDIKVHPNCCDEKPQLLSFNRNLRPFTISFHALNEAESKHKFLSVIAESMPKNLFLDLKSLRNHFLCHNMEHSCFMILESMPCPEQVMVMELSYYIENDSHRAVNKIFDVLKHVAVNDPKQFDLLVYCDGLNFSGFSSIPFFLNNLMDCMAIDDRGFFEKRVKSLSFLLPDCWRLREMCSSELEAEMKLNSCAAHVTMPPLYVYTDVKCDHLYDHVEMDQEEQDKMMCQAKLAAHVFQKINPGFNITWRRAVLPTEFIQELY